MSLEFTSVDHSWQEPAATEKVAFRALAEAHRRGEVMLDGQWHYIAFPWATLIDQLQSGSNQARRLFLELRSLYDRVERLPGRRFTVCQHIRAPILEQVFRELSIEAVFWPHSTIQHLAANELGFRYLPFPLFPAQTIEASHPFGLRSDCPPPESDRPWLTSFVGAYNPNVYLSETRKALFDLRDQFPNIKVIRREAWHFDRAVYQEQMHGSAPCDETQQREEAERREYLEIMGQSQFTFCPTGSGPNSIRLFEAISLGSIPIVMTRFLALPAGCSQTDVHWREACLFCGDEPREVERMAGQIQTMRAGAIADMQKRLEQLAAAVLPAGWARILCYQLQESGNPVLS